MKKASSRPPPLDPSNLTAFGQVERGKGDNSDRGKDAPAKKKTSSHKSPKESTKEQLDNKWLERFAWVEARFLAKRFTLQVEPGQKTDVVDTERLFIPPVKKTTGATGQIKNATQPLEASGSSTAIQHVEAPGALIATQPVEAPGATRVM